MWMFERRSVWGALNYLMDENTDSIKRDMKVLDLIGYQSDRISALSSRVDALEKQLKKGKKNEKVLQGKETRKKQSRSKTGKLYKLYGV